MLKMFPKKRTIQLQKSSEVVSDFQSMHSMQGDREKDLGLPVSPLFDRAKPGVSKSQVSAEVLGI